MIPNRHWLLLLTGLSKKVILAWFTTKGNQKNVVEESITPPISVKNKIDTFNKTDKPQASNKTVDTPKSNKTDTVKSLDKSRSTQIIISYYTIYPLSKESYTPSETVRKKVGIWMIPNMHW